MIPDINLVENFLERELQANLKAFRESLDDETKERANVIARCPASKDEYFSDMHCYNGDACDGCPVYEKKEIIKNG
ncbi:hypothetical protein GOV13_04675 [Candidatus Pacearchaeota archaeon]|nr:hypothetical protein [Candidatus Pacearchaeota archaeon]